MRLGIRGKLFLISFGVLSISVVVAYTYLRRELQRSLIDRIREDLTVRANLAAFEARRMLPSEPTRAEWDSLADELGRRARGRVTLIYKDGSVLGDSQVDTAHLPAVENHADRPEVQHALEAGRGVSQRLSSTVDERLLYVAVPFRQDDHVAGVARVALPLTEVDAAIDRLRSIVSVAFILAVAAATVLSTVSAEIASRTARSLTDVARRMAGGDLAARTGLTGADEFAQLGQTLDQLAQSLSATLAELRNERDRMRGVVSGMREGLLLLDRGRKVSLVNAALREMLLLGMDVEGRAPIEVIRHAELVRLLDEVGDSRQPATGEIELAGLKVRRLLVHVVPMAAGGLLAVFVDVTQLRKLETLRRDFVANASHELRTPIASIQSAAETLEEAAVRDPKAAISFIQIISRNAERLRNLVDDLLDLSRIESQDFKVRIEPIDVGGVVASVLDLFRERAAKKSIELRAECADGIRAAVDRRGLEHVVTNLVDNAVKYCGQGATVSVRVVPEGEKVLVEVQDTGPGIAPEHLPRVFERFYRVDAGRSRELGGTGLGLSIVKHLVDSMGGKVTAESELGKGTRFRVTLQGEVREFDSEAHERTMRTSA